MSMERVVVRGEGGGGMRRRKQEKKMKNAVQCGGKVLRLDSDASPLVAFLKNSERINSVGRGSFVFHGAAGTMQQQ